MATSMIKAPISLNDCESNQVVTLDNYTSAAPYVLPYDGYIIIDSMNNDRGYIRIVIRSPSGNVMPYIYMNITGVYQYQSLYVKKGMSVYVLDTNVESPVEMFYFPLTK